MTGKRTLMVLAPDPEAAEAVVRGTEWGITKVIWVSEPVPLVAFGLPEGSVLYEVSVVFRWAS